MTDYSKYDYSKLFTPMQIGSMTVKNRLVMSPMGTFTPMQDGTESEEGIAYYERRAKGGLGMIIIGAMFLSEKTAQGGPTYALWTTRAIPKMTVLTERVHRWNARIVCQISPGTGRNGMPDIGERVPISSSANPSFYNPNMICRPLETEEIKQIVEECRTAAINARMAGFDAIELHSHAGYLFDQFLSPIWNTRTDEYGGSLENRCRFSVECIKAIRESCPGMPILYRIALDHRFTGGRTLEDSLPILKILDEAGADAFDVDAGSYEAMDYIFPTTYVGENCMSYVCKEARKVTKKPLLNAGTHSPETALALIESGDADFVMFGRQSIADPDFASKIMHGHREDMRPCLICNEECIGRIFGRLTQVSCTVNPSTGFEDAMKLEKLPDARKIAVIGGGPGGLEAARIAALRGCSVTIYEKSDKLGGTFRAIASPSFKKRIREYIDWQILQNQKLGVQFKLHTEITADDPALADADEIFVATGSRPFVPPVPGRDGKNVISVIEAHEHGAPSDTVAICGGGLSGCDTALELAMKGKKVTILEMLDACARDVMPINKITLDRMLKEYHVTILTGARVVAMDENGVTAEMKDGSRRLIPAGTIVTAFGQKPARELPNAIQAKYPCKTIVIGDAEHVGKAGNAIRQGFYAAMSLQ